MLELLGRIADIFERYLYELTEQSLRGNFITVSQARVAHSTAHALSSIHVTPPFPPADHNPRALTDIRSFGSRSKGIISW